MPNAKIITGAAATAETVLEALGRHPGATVAELAEAAGIGRSTASKALAALEDEGKVRRLPGGREG
ncbi:MAG: MarR family transcriptional regulator, partial [Actinomycetota bacterium]|nr:MarR family transcriptional regulator [Actinomycetota bacterium]